MLPGELGLPPTHRRGNKFYLAADISGRGVDMCHLMPLESRGAPAHDDDMDEGIPLVGPRPGVPVQIPRLVPEDIDKKTHAMTHLPPEQGYTICAQARLANEPHHR